MGGKQAAFANAAQKDDRHLAPGGMNSRLQSGRPNAQDSDITIDCMHGFVPLYIFVVGSGIGASQ